MSKSIINLMKMICSCHRKRGEEVMEFNLSPHYYKDFDKKEFVQNNKAIPIVCDGWNRIGDYYHLELNTAMGFTHVTALTYKLRQ